MNTSLAEGKHLARRIAAELHELDFDAVDVVLCPPFFSLVPVAEVVVGTHIGVGAQNASQFPNGAHTGEISVEMLDGIAAYVILGHSERRSHYAESDYVVAEKLAAVTAAGMTPILCVGEPESVREQGNAERYVREEVRACLAHYRPEQPLVIAYEPIWAIGTGTAATVPQIEYLVESIREELAELYDTDTSRAVRVLYGGSVNAANAAELAASSTIDGALVGGASLDAAEFAGIVRAVADNESR